MNDRPQRLDVEFTIQWEAPWHVGSGQGTAGVDRLVRRRACGRRGARLPYVPASELKGVLRHQCERLLTALGGQIVSPHVAPAAEPPDELLEDFVPLRHSALVIDRLFGTRYEGECLFVEDALPPESPHDRQVSLPTMAVGRTSIDRLTGTVRHRTLFVTEVVIARDAVLHGRLQARHGPGVLTPSDGDSGFPMEYSLLLAGLLSIDALGGDKSAGLGRCRIDVPDQHVRWNDIPTFPLSQALASFEESEWIELLKMVREDNGSAAGPAT
jgi:CRISPR/Cas system CSM-associated protein Csm3 (group 7 of RAMP superfamily)